MRPRHKVSAKNACVLDSGLLLRESSNCQAGKHHRVDLVKSSRTRRLSSSRITWSAGNELTLISSSPDSTSARTSRHTFVSVFGPVVQSARIPRPALRLVSRATYRAGSMNS